MGRIDAAFYFVEKGTRIWSSFNVASLDACSIVQFGIPTRSPVAVGVSSSQGVEGLIRWMVHPESSTAASGVVGNSLVI